MPDLDAFDRRLLSILQRDADQTADRLADQVGLSPSAVLRRIKRLKADGVIIGTVAVVDPAKVGKPTFFIANLEIEREHPEMLSRLRQWLAAEEQVQEVFYVTGSSDFILVIAAPDVEAYDAMMGRLMADNPNIRRFTTNVALGISKRGLAVPVSTDITT